MKILVPALGSRGDVQPYVNLCQALDAAGHEATLATNPSLGSIVQEFGVRFAPVGQSIQPGRRGGLRIMAQSGRNWMSGFMKIIALGNRMVRDASQEVLEQARLADLVVVTDCGSGRARGGIPWAAILHGHPAA